jgi:hydrogenase expression/formation protein HypC
VTRWIDRDPLFARAEVEFAAIRRDCHMACVLEAAVGDYVIVHAGVAISRIDPVEAQRLLDEIEAIDLDDWPADESNHEIP